MGFGDAVRSCFSNYATFSGRARRSEYWWFTLFCILGNVVAGVLDAMIFGATVVEAPGFYGYVQQSVIGGIFSLAVFLPSLAVTVRRLHDTDRSGWWLLILFVPVLGVLLLLFWMIKRGDTGPNSHGPDPIDSGVSP